MRLKQMCVLACLSMISAVSYAQGYKSTNNYGAPVYNNMPQEQQKGYKSVGTNTMTPSDQVRNYPSPYQGNMYISPNVEIDVGSYGNHGNKRKDRGGINRSSSESCVQVNGMVTCR